MNLESRNLESQIWIWTKEGSFSSDMGTVHKLIEEVIGAVRAEHWTDRDMFALELTLEETLTNAVKHGNHSDPGKQVRFSFKLCSDKICVRIEDEGEGFDPYALADPREPENQMIPSGRGVLLIKHFATSVQWNEQGNIVEFEKFRTSSERPETVSR